MRAKAGYIGIDPGAKGAFALYSADVVYAWDFNPATTFKAIEELALNYRIQLVYLERVHSQPGNSGKSMFAFGDNFGWWRGILEAMRLPCQLVEPKKWQACYSIGGKEKGKDAPSLAVARRLFPSVALDCKCHDGRADALLIAYYAAQTDPNGRK